MKHNRIKSTFLFLLLLFTLPAVCAATDPSPPMVAGGGPPAYLDQRIAALEAEVQNRPGLAEWLDRISLSGILEAEAGYESVDYDDPDADDEDASDATLATMEIGIDAAICDHVAGHVLFLWEEDDTEPVDMDEGFITLSGGEHLPLYLRAGKMYVPFGRFESHMISDPLTLELGETRESAIQAGIDFNGFYGSAYAFNGDVDEDGEDSHLDNFGANAGVAMERGNFSLDVGCCWINNILDSDVGGDIFAQEAETAESLGVSFALRKYVPGAGAHAVVTFGPVCVIGEYIAALDEPEWNITDTVPGSMAGLGLDAVEKGKKYSAYNLELAYTCAICGRETTFAVGHQGTKDMEEFLAEKRFLGSVGIGIFDQTTLALEYCRDEFENDDTADMVTAKLAVEF